MDRPTMERLASELRAPDPDLLADYSYEIFGRHCQPLQLAAVAALMRRIGSNSPALTFYAVTEDGQQRVAQTTGSAAGFIVEVSADGAPFERVGLYAAPFTETELTTPLGVFTCRGLEILDRNTAASQIVGWLLGHEPSLTGHATFELLP